MKCAFDSPPINFDAQMAKDPLVNWRGPRGFMLLFWEVDFSAGGASRLCLRSPAGRDSWVEGARLEIVEPERVVFSGDLNVHGERILETPGTITFRRI